MRGLFITFEGVQCSGKSTQIDLLTESLLSRGIKAIKTREPGGISEAENIRLQIFALKGQNAITPQEELEMFFWAREIWLRKLVIPNLLEGNVIISDRSVDSSRLVQGIVGGLGVDLVDKYMHDVMGEFMPDRTYLMDLELEEFSERMSRNQRTDNPWRFLPIEFYQASIEGYRYLVNKDELDGSHRWKVLNASDPISSISEVILEDTLSLIEFKEGKESELNMR